MVMYNFGYAANAIRASKEMYALRDIGSALPTQKNMLDSINGDVVKAQIAQAVILGNNIDFLWGVNLWGSRSYKVTS